MNEFKNKHREFIKSVLNRYCPVSDSSISLLLRISEVRHFAKGQMLLQIGEKERHKHILCEGAIVSYYIDDNGKLYHKNIFLKSDFVASTVSALKGEPSEFALEIIEDVILISFNYKKYRQLIADNSDLNNFYIAYLEKNWIIDKEKREVEIVLKKTKERYLDFIDTHPNIESRIALKYIASHLGITSTQMSRIRKNINEESS